jgi:hypothetical protein
MATDTLNGMPGYSAAQTPPASRLKNKLVRLEKKLRLLITRAERTDDHQGSSGIKQQAACV